MSTAANKKQRTVSPTINQWEEAEALELRNKEQNLKNEIEILRRQNAEERGDDPIDDDDTPLDNDIGLDDVEQMDEDTKDDKKNWITVAGRIRRYKAVINIKNVSGDTNQQKLKKVQQAVSDITNYMGARIHFYNKDQYVMVEFGSKEHMEEACKRKIDENSEFVLQSIQNRGDDEIKNRTVVIRDLPLNMDKEVLKKKMEQYGEGKVTDIKTKVTGPWLTAHVAFESEKSVGTLSNIWSIVYMKDFCRMAPANVTAEEIEQRNRFTAKLTNLPFGITAFDLKEIIEKTNAKICFIPRTRDKYARLRYAFVSFETENELLTAVQGEDQYIIKGQKLRWVEPDKKTCHKCGSPAHLVIDCEEREASYQRKQKLAQFRKVYTRYRVPNYRKITQGYVNNQRNGYANNPDNNYYDNTDQLENPRNNNREYENTNDFVRQQGRGNFDQESKDVYSLLMNIKTEITNMKNEIKTMNNRIENLEKNRKGTKDTPINVTEQQNQSNIKDKGKAFNSPFPRQLPVPVNQYNLRPTRARSFNQNQNDNNKRTAQSSSSDSSKHNNIPQTGGNIHKASKPDYANDDQEMNAIKLAQQQQEQKMNSISDKLDALTNALLANNGPSGSNNQQGRHAQ
jgi:RNA recognition motif. (a.k.a. RRM, RBD, or RNP domain)